MKYRIVFVTLMSLAGSIAPAHTFGANITYFFKDYPGLQNGHTLSGDITTDGTIGAIGNDSIMSFNLVVSGGSVNFSLTNSFVTASDMLLQGTVATDTVLALNTLASQNRFVVGSTGGDATKRVRWLNDFNFNIGRYDAGDPFSTNPSWSAFGATLGTFTEDWIIAEVPEPTTAFMMVVGLALLATGGFVRQRR